MALSMTLTGSNGDTISFDDNNYVPQVGLMGFGIPSPILRIDPSASNGGTFRFSKRDVREINLPLMILGTSRQETETKLRRLSYILRDKAVLAITYENGEIWTLDVYLAGGGETQFGSTGADHFCQWDLALQAPQPFWQSTAPFSVSIVSSSAARGLLAGSSPKSLAFLRVKSSQAFGTVTVTNTGDVNAPAVWTINGPSTLTTIQLNGVGFTFNDTITSATTITIDCEAGTVKDQTGANRYSGLGTAPKLFSIPPGDQTLTVSVTGATSDTKVTGTFSSRREVLH
jgi:hypothetical protein